MGSYGHRALLVDSETLDHSSYADLPFRRDLFRSTTLSVDELLPAVKRFEDQIDWAMAGLMTFLPDGYPLVGPLEHLPGLYVAVGVWVMYSVGVGRFLARCIIDGHPPQHAETHRVLPNRFPREWTAKTPVVRRQIMISYEQRCAMSNL